MRIQTQFVELTPITQWALVSQCENYWHFGQLGRVTKSTRKETSNTGCWACPLPPPPLLQRILLPCPTLACLSQMSPLQDKHLSFMVGGDFSHRMGWRGFLCINLCCAKHWLWFNGRLCDRLSSIWFAHLSRNWIRNLETNICVLVYIGSEKNVLCLLQ